MELSLVNKNQHNKGQVTLSPITVREDYLQKWNSSHYHDFVCITRDGELLRNTLYRVGGIGKKNIEGEEYFILLKYVEEFYEDSITKDKKRKPHLAGHWCIIDKHGNEKVVLDKFKSPRLLGGVIYAVDNSYFNIKTGEQYGGRIYTHITSDEYVFLDNAYDDDKSKRGVMKISKKDGSWELFKKS